MPTIAEGGLVATSHPLASSAGARALDRGGNAVDAALAAAAVLTVAEPTDNGPGGDAFAIVWADGELHGLNGSGRSPARIDGMHELHGPRSVTVPGAVRAWADLAERFGRLGLDAALAPAADLAESGLVCTARIADKWARAARAPWAAPGAGGRYALPELGRTLRRIAEEGPDAFYTGEVAAAIASACWLAEDDLAAHRSEWVEPLRLRYRGVEVCELPPNGQGAAALIALGILEGMEDASLHEQIEAMKLALADTYAYVADGPLQQSLLTPEHFAARRAEIDPERAGSPAPAGLPRGGTTYLCVVDGDGMAVSLIQSVYEAFGSGVVAPATGVALQNRAAGFSSEASHPNALAPAKRPFHTIIPGMLLEGGELLGPFGVMGGAMQPQGHVQVVRSIVDGGLDPQSALEAPRWRVGDGWEVALEPGLAEEADALRGCGHPVRLAENQHEFGVGQAIVRCGEALLAGSDPRGDGAASSGTPSSTSKGY